MKPKQNDPAGCKPSQNFAFAVVKNFLNCENRIFMMKMAVAHAACMPQTFQSYFLLLDKQTKNVAIFVFPCSCYFKIFSKIGLGFSNGAFVEFFFKTLLMPLSGENGPFWAADSMLSMHRCLCQVDRLVFDG